MQLPRELYKELIVDIVDEQDVYFSVDEWHIMLYSDETLDHIRRLDLQQKLQILRGNTTASILTYVYSAVYWGLGTHSWSWAYLPCCRFLKQYYEITNNEYLCKTIEVYLAER